MKIDIPYDIGDPILVIENEQYDGLCIKCCPFRLSDLGNLDNIMNELCPICGYKLSDCQCLVGGNAHPDRWKKIKVVKDHLYMLNSVQIKHVIWLESKWETSYDDPEMNDILKELKGDQQC